MKVALIARSTLFTIKGGDTTQVINTARELKTLGVDATVFRSTDAIKYTDFDLMHFFNIVRPADHLLHIRKSNLPYVISTIYLDYTAFDLNERKGFYQVLFKTAGKSGAEFLKNIFRFVKNQDKLVSPEYLLGHMQAIRKIVKNASLLLPNSHSEYQRLKNDTGIDVDYKVIPNGVNPEIFGTLPKHIERKEKVITVAQIYGMKNQHRLIEACKTLKIPLDIIGKAPPNHLTYFNYCKEIAGKNVRFHDFMPQQELLKYYAAAKVHALPSWFETTGLSSLEGGAMGCNLVVGTGGDTREYFKDLAWYCNADNQQSINLAVERAMNQQNNKKLRDFILSEYTWPQAAKKTKKAYEKVLDEQG